MVRLSSSFILIALAATSFAAPIIQRTVPQVEADVAAIDSKITALDQAIKNFNGNNVSAALVPP